VVVVTIKKHGGGEGTEEPVPFQDNMASSRLTPAELEAIRYDRIGHLITKPVPTVSGVCKMCKNRSRYRCVRCKVCLHPECFIGLHVREGGEDAAAMRRIWCCKEQERMLLYCGGVDVVKFFCFFEPKFWCLY
jgi:hypothetical protein